MRFPYVIVGAGLAGITMAERIASQMNEKVLIIEKRSHIGGNVYDSYDKEGILIHNYGPIPFTPMTKRYLTISADLQNGTITSTGCSPM